MLSACQDQKIDNSQPEIRTTILLGSWDIIGIEGIKTIQQFRDDWSVSLAFAPPCYEMGDGHCNPSHGTEWTPARKDHRRLAVNGYSGCNGFGAEARIEGSTLSLEPIVATQMGCPDIAAQESLIFQILSSRPTLSIDQDKVQISSQHGKIIAQRSINP